MTTSPWHFTSISNKINLCTFAWNYNHKFMQPSLWCNGNQWCVKPVLCTCHLPSPTLVSTPGDWESPLIPKYSSKIWEQLCSCGK